MAETYDTHSESEPASVIASTGKTDCECGAPLSEGTVTVRRESPYKTLYGSAVCGCGLFHYVEVSVDG